MTGKPKISVIIPAYDAAKYLPRTIESVYQQTCQDFEIILVDDGSKDNTGDVIPHRANLIYRYQENSGPAAARNTGIRCASGDYLVFLDADDTISPNKLRSQADFLDQNPDVDIVYSDGYLFHIQADGSKIEALFSQAGVLDKHLGRPEESIPILAVHNTIPIHAAMLRRQAVLQVNGFDEARQLMHLEDWDFWYRLAEKFTFQYMDAIVAYYQVTDISLSKNNFGMINASIFIEQKFQQTESYLKLSRSIRSKSTVALGLLALRFGDAKLARQRFAKAMELNPLNYFSWLGYGLTLLGEPRATILFHRLHRLIKVRGGLRL